MYPAHITYFNSFSRFYESFRHMRKALYLISPLYGLAKTTNFLLLTAFSWKILMKWNLISHIYAYRGGSHLPPGWPCWPRKEWCAISSSHGSFTNHLTMRCFSSNRRWKDVEGRTLAVYAPLDAIYLYLKMDFQAEFETHPVFRFGGMCEPPALAQQITESWIIIRWNLDHARNLYQLKSYSYSCLLLPYH
jgi:hypothetical protein